MPDIQCSPPPLPRQLRFVVALAAVSASERPPSGTVWTGADAWLESLLSLLDLERDALPPDVNPEDVSIAAGGRDTWSNDERRGIGWALIHAALAPETREDTKEPRVAYSAVARAAAHRTLSLLGLDSTLLSVAEARVGATLAAALDGDKSTVDEAVSKQNEGWGGSLGRRIATGAGVIAGGVIVGVTGGLAAPAIAALLAPLGMGAIFTAGAAPLVLGTLFGVTGGGLTGWRVAERWRGVDEFAFIEVGAGTKPSKEEVDDLKKHAPIFDVDFETRFQGQLESDDVEPAAQREVERSRRELEGRLAEMSLEAHTDQASPSPPSTPLKPGEFKKPTTPSLTATIVVPGLLTVSHTEAISAWRAACSPYGHWHYGTDTPDSKVPVGLKDGRDVYLLRYETQTMLDTGRDLESWVASKLRNAAATEVVKHTVLSAYYAAIALPLSVYKLSTMALDNSWVGAQDKAIKAGRLLGEVLAQRVQGERPVVLVGTSVGALTVLHALLYLATLDGPPIVDSVFFISLPAAPTEAEWASVRQTVARRVVNAWTGSDMVLAGVVRLHEVVSRGVTGNNGTRVAGLGPVMQNGVEDVDLCDVLNGHSEINTSIGDILEVLQVDD